MQKKSPDDAASASIVLDGYWARQEEWRLVDAIVLLVGLDPRTGTGLFLRDCLLKEGEKRDYPDVELGGLSIALEDLKKRNPEDLQKLRLAFEVAANAVTAYHRSNLVIGQSSSGRLRLWEDLFMGGVVPRDFLSWARDRGYEIPENFATLIDRRTRTDLERALAVSISAREDLERELSEIKARPQEAREGQAADVLPTKTRNTLLLICAALMHEAKIDVKHPSKAGELIARIIQGLGLSVASRSIANYVNEINKLLKEKRE